MLGLGLAACASSAAGTRTPSGTVAYNASRHGFSEAANGTARGVIDRLQRAGVACTDPHPSTFALLRTTYVRQHLALPLGAVECSATFHGVTENVVVEVFRTGRPNAADFVDRKAAIICRRGIALGRKADGTNDFPGLPYVMAADKAWVLEPDTVAFNDVIATALGRPARNACGAIAPN